MPELDDITLIKQYAEGDESAFTTIIQRHIHLVYSAALRQCRNPSHAEEVTQAVFILLARKAKSLCPKTVLSGWLYQAARLTTASLIKREIRRQRREQEVYMQTLTEPDTLLWKQISPLLDEAMGRLGENDRNAIVLRFFENRTPEEVAAALKLNDVTARKRVSRALERLRTFFAKRGVVLTTASIAGTISGNSVHAAPAALANSATAVMLAKGTVASASTLTLVKGALKIMAWSKAATAMTIGAAVLLTMGAGVIGGIVGIVLGCVGGCVGAYCSYKAAKGPRERRFVILASAALVVFVFSSLAALSFLPQARAWIWTCYIIVLVLGLRLLNRRQRKIRQEEQIQ